MHRAQSAFMITSMLLWWSIQFSSGATERLPNIVIFYTDDQGWGDHERMNPGLLETPTMLRLADEGLNFTDAHSACSVCTPSRYGLLTGRTPSRVRPNGGVANINTKPIIEDDVPTIATLLRDGLGYETAMVGKWHLGLDIPGSRGDRMWDEPISGGPVDHGFDEFYGLMASLNYGFLTFIQNDTTPVPADFWTKKQRVVGGVINAYPQQKTYTFLEPREEPYGSARVECAPDFDIAYVMENLTNHALDFIDRNHDTHFFLYFAATTPHHPVIAHPDFQGNTEFGPWTDMVEELDFRAGQLLNRLDHYGIGNDTLFIWTSDNGPETLVHNLERFGYNGRGDFKGSKRTLYEGGSRVPTFMRWPNGITKPNRMVSLPISQLDIMATLLDITDGTDLVGYDLEDRTDSVSFAKVFSDTCACQQSREKPLLYEDSKARMAIRLGDMKYLPTKKEAYNLADDPFEKNNMWRTLTKATINEVNSMIKKIQKQGATVHDF